MKNRILALFAILLSMSVILPACGNDDDDIINFGGLPDYARQFILGFFPGEEPYAIEQKGKGENRRYEVVMTGGYEIDFDHTGNWTKVEAPGHDALPNTSFILPPILGYIESYYPLHGINSISRNRNGYEVELTFGPDLEFDSQGRFIRVDD